MLKQKMKVPFRKLKYVHHISDIQIRNLKRHRESVHENKYFLCNDCNFKTTTERTFYLHVRKVHDFKFTCDNCSLYTTTKKKELNQHILICHAQLNKFLTL